MTEESRIAAQSGVPRTFSIVPGIPSTYRVSPTTTLTGEMEGTGKGERRGAGAGGEAGSPEEERYGLEGM